MSSETVLRAGRRTVRISRADKLLFPGDGLTKADLASYYRAAAPRMLPHPRGRALMLERHPDGIEGESFMQKEVSHYFPDRVHRTTVSKEGGSVTHLVCDDTATLHGGTGVCHPAPLAEQGRPPAPPRPARLRP